MTTATEHPLTKRRLPRQSKARKAVERWENEGGQFPSPPRTAVIASDVSPLVRDQAADSEDLASMRAKFIADFAGGSMGQHHNTYEHRSLVLRQLTGERTR